MIAHGVPEIMVIARGNGGFSISGLRNLGMIWGVGPIQDQTKQTHPLNVTFTVNSPPILHTFFYTNV